MSKLMSLSKRPSQLPRPFGCFGRSSVSTSYNTRGRMATRGKRSGTPDFGLNVGLDLYNTKGEFPFDTYFTNCYVLCGAAFLLLSRFPIHQSYRE